jgi:hypothetical protein
MSLTGLIRRGARWELWNSSTVMAGPFIAGFFWLFDSLFGSSEGPRYDAYDVAIVANGDSTYAPRNPSPQ